MWYLDCFSFKALLGYDFPVNSYFSKDLSTLLATAQKMLINTNTGIDAVTISKKTKGHNPIKLEE